MVDARACSRRLEKDRDLAFVPTSAIYGASGSRITIGWLIPVPTELSSSSWTRSGEFCFTPAFALGSARAEGALEDLDCLREPMDRAERAELFAFLLPLGLVNTLDGAIFTVRSRPLNCFSFYCSKNDDTLEFLTSFL